MSSAEQLADNYARGEINDVPKCGQGKRTKAEQHHKFGWFGPPPIPVATSTPLMNPAFECSTSSMMDAQKEAREDFYAGNEKSLTEEMWDTPAVGNTNMDLSNFCSWASNSMKDQSNDYDERNDPTSSGESSTVGPQLTMLMPMQKMPITPKTQFATPNPMFYPHQFDHPNHFPYPPYSTGHLPMPIYQENEVQTIIVKDNKQEHSENAKDGIYRNCLVCGDKNYKCGKHTGTGLQICNGCQEFFKRVVKTDADKKDTFQCTQGSENFLISKDTRNSCEFCRFQTCLKAGMDPHKIVELKAKREREKQKQTVIQITPMDSASQNSGDDDIKSNKPTSLIVRERLPLELECEIFACLKLPIQRKFISGLGTEIYEMCAPKIRAVLKTKKLFNPSENGWGKSIMPTRISPDGLTVTNIINTKNYVFAMHGFPANSSQDCRLDNFPGTVIYYFEFKQTTFLPHFLIGFDNWDATSHSHTCALGIEYGSTKGCECCWLIYGNRHPFECFEDAIKPEWKWGAREGGNVAGCGLLLNSKNKLAIFGTLNGILLGKQIPIKRPGHPLFPTATVENSSVEANFGTNSAKPFEYDIDKCPGLVFE